MPRLKPVDLQRPVQSLQGLVLRVWDPEREEDHGQDAEARIEPKGSASDPTDQREEEIRDEKSTIQFATLHVLIAFLRCARRKDLRKSAAPKTKPETNANEAIEATRQPNLTNSQVLEDIGRDGAPARREKSSHRTVPLSDDTEPATSRFESGMAMTVKTTFRKSNERASPIDFSVLIPVLFKIITQKIN